MQHKPDWEFWLDCHLSPIIAKWMHDETGLIFKSAFILGLHGLSDLEIFELAKRNTLVILISKDSDLPDLISRFGSPPKLINLRIGNCDNKTVFKFLLDNFESVLTKLADENIQIVDLEP